jgi:hypothetical protein
VAFYTIWSRIMHVLAKWQALQNGMGTVDPLVEKKEKIFLACFSKKRYTLWTVICIIEHALIYK